MNNEGLSVPSKEEEGEESRSPLRGKKPWESRRERGGGEEREKLVAFSLSLSLWWPLRCANVHTYIVDGGIAAALQSMRIPRFSPPRNGKGGEKAGGRALSHVVRTFRLRS